MGLTPAPVNAWFLAWIALVPLWVLVTTAIRSPESRWRPVRLGLVWGLGYHGLALSWITGLHPLMWMGMSWLASVAIALFAWSFITLWGAVLVGIWVWLMSKLCVARSAGANKLLPASLRILMGAALWSGLEALWGYGPLYWTSLSYTQSPYNLAILHLGQISGPLAITAAIVAVNGLLAEAWLQGRRRHLATGAGLLVGLHLLGFGLYSYPVAQTPANQLQIGIIQGNVPTDIKLDAEGIRRSIEGYTTGYERLAEQGVDAVLTPEGAIPEIWSAQRWSRSALYRAMRRTEVPIWLGTFVREGDKITQSILTITGDGEPFSRYNKVKLVPLGEYIPFEPLLGELIGRVSSIGYGMVPGHTDQRVDTPLGRAIVGICYESAFPQLFRDQTAAGGEFMLTASNNDPYSAAMMAQHHAQDLMRAIESDRWAVRATNTGYSGVIDPHGHTIWMSGVNTYELHVATIYRRQTRTPYVRWGDWLTPFLLFGALAGWGYTRTQSLRQSHSP